MKKPSVEMIANVAIILLCILVGTVFVKNSFFKPDRAAQQKQNMVGKTISLDGMDPHAANVTVLLALSSACKFCDASTAFYQQLTTLRQKPGAQFQTVGVFREPVDTAREYLTRKGLSLDSVISHPLSDLGVDGTPTLFVINPNGKIIYASVGLLDDAKQKEVLHMLGTSST
ncbi:MAG TPA: hypothetical protein VFC63_21520 [Blastocatellia bacterium]|nr:hypothetical protein [Blastocatellia bacterium]